MNEDERELLRRLFALAAALLEDSIATAVAGQSPRLQPRQAKRYARRLRATAQHLLALATVADSAARQ